MALAGSVNRRFTTHGCVIVRQSRGHACRALKHSAAWLHQLPLCVGCSRVGLRTSPQTDKGEIVGANGVEKVRATARVAAVLVATRRDHPLLEGVVVANRTSHIAAPRSHEQVAPPPRTQTLDELAFASKAVALRAGGDAVLHPCRCRNDINAGLETLEAVRQGFARVTHGFVFAEVEGPEVGKGSCGQANDQMLHGIGVQIALCEV